MPNLLVIGAMKCATSSICSFFERHPNVFFVEGSELNFFSVDEMWLEGIEAYRRQFANSGGNRLVGEGSNSYSQIDAYPETPGRIHGTVPDAKIVYSVRHPIERLVSAWAQLRYQSPDRVSHDINETVRDHPELIVNQSFYWRQLSAYLEYFPRDQIWIGFLEDLKNDAEGFYDSLCAFCGLSAADAGPRTDHWKNKTDGRFIVDSRYTKLRQLAGFKALRRLAPRGLKDAIKNRMKVATPSMDETMMKLDLPEDIRRALKEDAQEFLCFTGKPTDFWAL